MAGGAYRNRPPTIPAGIAFILARTAILTPAVKGRLLIRSVP